MPKINVKNKKTRVAKKPAPKQSKVVTTSGYSIAQETTQTVRVRGSEILGVVSNDTFSDGAIRLQGVWDLNPACWNSSRLCLLAKAYEKYRFNSFTVKYVPRVSTNTSGLVAISADFDPDDELPQGEGGLTTAAQHAVFAQGTAFQSFSAHWRRDPADQQWYFASFRPGSTLANTSQGRVYALGGGDHAGIMGSVLIQYDISLTEPDFELNEAGEQFQFGSINSSAATAANTRVTVNANIDPNGDSHLIELKPNYVSLNGVEGPASFNMTSTGPTYTLRPGQSVFITRSDGKYYVYADLASAMAKAACLWTINALTSLTIAGRYRRLIKGSDY